MTTDLREVQLPSRLCEAVEHRYSQHFGNLEQLLTFLLEELARDDAEQMDRAEQRLIEQRLKDLGYV